MLGCLRTLPSAIGRLQDFFQIVFCATILLPSIRAKKMLQNDTLCIIFGLVYQKLQRSKRYSMRDRIKNCDGLCSLYCSYRTIERYHART